VAQLGDGAVSVRSPREALGALESVTVGVEGRARIARGQAVAAEGDHPDANGARRAVLVDDSGSILAVAERQGSVWAPKVVLIDG
jgi:hypothetical protein